MLDYLVVGSGIGAFSICRRLAEHDKHFKIISDHAKSATSVAGGIINPIVLKRFKPFWNALEFYDEAVDFYKDIQRCSNEVILTEKRILRIFSSIEEQNDWFNVSERPVLNKFLEPHIIDHHPNLKADLKLGLMKNAFLVNAGKLLCFFYESYHDKFDKVHTKFDHSRLIFKKDHYQYGDLSFRSVIFTEGHKVINNPFFSYLPIYGNRGDYLIFRSTELKVNELVKGKEFLIPLGNDLYKFGATFDRNLLTDKTPLAYKKTLKRSLESLINVKFEVVRFESGVRPNVKDRKPILGQHPAHKNMFIMNGFGSRGLFMSPLLSKWMLKHLESEKELLGVVDIKRFHDLY